MIQLEPRHLDRIRQILEIGAPQIPAFLFGSRAQGQARPFSDVDIVLCPAAPLSFAQLTKLELAFEESTLPFRVDISDWNRLSPEFRKQIKKDLTPL